MTDLSALLARQPKGRPLLQETPTMRSAAGSGRERSRAV